MPRDMSRKQFETALQKRGFETVGFMGYWRLPLPNGQRMCVSELNGGERLRNRLAYLLRVLEQELAKQEATP